MFGLPLLFLPIGWILKLIFFATITCSCLMHISERKHSLPGLYPFNKYSDIFLRYDRIMARICVIIVIFYTYIKWTMISTWILVYAALGLVSLIISEKVATENWTFFMVTHSTWHFIAYTTAYLIISI